MGFGCGWAKLNVVFLCRQVRWRNTSFNFAKRWHFRPPFLSVYSPVVGRPTLAPNVSRPCVVREVHLQIPRQYREYSQKYTFPTNPIPALRKTFVSGRWAR